MDIESFLQANDLPPAFARTAEDHYSPLARWLDGTLLQAPGRCPVLGVNGAQGTGKSTLCKFLVDVLQSDHDRRAVCLSIDDLYLTHGERRLLAHGTHPLLATRGVPGTHDVRLGCDILQRLRAAGENHTVAVPRFDKATDDRMPEERWPRVRGPIDLVILEGWCVASVAAEDDSLATAVNELEQNEDIDGRWRRFVNDALRRDYPPLFDTLDALIFLQAPDFEAIRRWRGEQEQKLAARRGGRGEVIMAEAAIGRFIAHFERITRRNLQLMPGMADVTLSLDAEHRVVAADYRSR